jgi:hypothetical protein
MNRRERLTDLSPTRRALLGAGITTLALSLVLSIAPAFAKNTSAGSVKIHDVSTGTDYGDASNDPTVCTFTVVFDFPDGTQTGTWEIFKQDAGWNATDVSGTYDATASGTDETDPITLDAGHYKLEYQATGSNSTKSKTFWIDDACAAAGASASASASESPSSDPSTPPSEDPTPTATPTDSPTDEPTPSTDSVASTAPTPTATPTATPTDTPSDPPSSDPTSTPDTESGVQAVTGSSQPSATPAEPAPSGPSGTDQLPDTSFGDTVSLTSLLTALGLLLIVAAHPFIRRSAHADRA